MSDKKIKKQIFLWYGENDFEVNQTVKGWLTAFEEKYSSFNVITIDNKDFRSKDNLLREMKTTLQVDSLFGSNKLIILKNFIFQGLDKEVSDLLKDSLGKLSETFFVVFVQTEKPDSRLTIFKELKKYEKTGQAEVKEFTLPKGVGIINWVKKRFQYYNAQIDTRAVELIVSFVGNNLWQLDTEIHKLSNYKKGQPITDEDVRLLVKGKFNDDIFALMDAIATKDKSQIINLMSDQLNSGASEMYLLAMLVRQFRLLRQVKEMFEVENVRSKDDIARALKMHPFVAQKTLGQISKFDIVELDNLYKNLLYIEHAMKSKNHDFKVLFDKFVADL